MGVGIAMVIIFNVLPVMVEKQIRATVLKGTVLTEPDQGLTAKQYDDWRYVSVEIDYYMWNITNLQDVLYNGVKPIVREVGPFGYNKTKSKFNVTWSAEVEGGNDHALVSFNEVTTFVPILSGTPQSGDAQFLDGSTSKITTINVPYLAAISSTSLGPNLDTTNQGNSASETQLHLAFAHQGLLGAHGQIFKNDTTGNSLNFIANFRRGSISSMLQIIMLTYKNWATSGHLSDLGPSIYADFAASEGVFNESSCGGACTGNTTHFRGCLQFQSNVYRCGYRDYMLTNESKTSNYANQSLSFQGVFELHRPINVNFSATLLESNFSLPNAYNYSLLNLVSSKWPAICAEAAVGNYTSTNFAACSTTVFDFTTCGTVCQWIGILTNRDGDNTAAPAIQVQAEINNGTNITVNTKYRWLVNYALMKAPHAENTQNLPNVYNVPWMSSWDDFAALQFGSCTIMRIANGISPFGTPEALATAGTLIKTSFSSNAAAAMLGGIAIEPCAQNWIGTWKPAWSSAWAVSNPTPARWRPTVAEASAALAAISTDQNVFLYWYGITIALPGGTFQEYKASTPTLFAVTDFLLYIAKYLVLYPRFVSNAAAIGLAWNPITGTPLLNSYGTGLYVGGGGGLFTTRNADEFLFGYKTNDPIVKGAFSAGLQGPNVTFDPANVPTSTVPKTQLYTGADGNNDRITFYKKYYGMDHITYVNDFYDSLAPIPVVLPQGRRYCNSVTPPTVRNAFAHDCKVWNEEETIDGLTDGFKAPFTFNEGGSAVDMSVWVPEGWRHVLFKKTEDITFKDIKMWKYTMDFEGFTNLTDAANDIDGTATIIAKRYFMTNHPSGVASRQRSDAMDLFVSFPHFLHADRSFFVNQLDINLNATVEKHGSYLSVDPLSGRTMTGRKRLQVGVFLSRRRISDSSFNGAYGKLINNYAGNSGAADNQITTPTGSCTNNLYIPIFWASEGKDISDDDANTFVSKIYGTRKTFLAVQISLVLIGAVNFVVFLILCIRSARATTGTAV
jgi:hypothetical protein